MDKDILTPLVSIVVRSMGRPELRLALLSIAAQDYPRIETILVDATDGTHPPLPDIDWKPGHVLRKLGGGRRLSRPKACNVGLDAVRGDWFCFLDDDDTYEPDHVSTLIRTIRQNPDALLVYGRSNMLRPDGQVEKVFGTPFNRAMMYHGPLFYWQASLIARKVRDLGCRFDEVLDICEDRDFLNQIAEHGDFVFVPTVTFNYRPDLGTSGTGRGPNWDAARKLYFDGMLNAKWAGPREYHTTRVGAGVRQAIIAYGRGDVAGSRALLERVLSEYPEDPSALHAMARLNLEANRLREAESQVRLAVEFIPDAAEFRYTHSLILQRLGDFQKARQAAQFAGADPSFRQLAEQLLSRLPTSVPRAWAVPAPASISRNQPCPCGSGKRYKHCCGAKTLVPIEIAKTFRTSADDQAVANAAERFRQGEAFASKGILDPIDPERLASAQSALEAARIYRELGELRREFDFLTHASRLENQSQIRLRLVQCADELFADRSWDSLRRQALVLIGRINARRETATENREGEKPRIHLVNDFRAIGGSESRTFRLYQVLSPFAEVVLWSQSEPDVHYRALCPDMRVLDPSKGIVPMGGTLVIVSNHLYRTPWMDAVTTYGRIVFCVNTPGLVNLKPIITALTLMDELQADPLVEFTYPSQMWRNRMGLGGVTEYPPTDTQRFTRQRPHGQERSRLIVGRLARADKMKFHPDDPALIRRIINRGHICRIMDGTPLTGALQSETRSGQVELLPLNAMDARDFLDGLDCFLYWKHPLWVETGCNAILEAMAMELPVIMFARDLGVAELIEHGKDGFLAETEEEALECLDRLAASPELRKSVGQAARRKVLATLDRQNADILDFYLGEAAAARPNAQASFVQQ
jgi:glycosyltransferase involved in cell wall biosynthesis